MSSTFRALRHANYRLWFTGAVVSNTGTWMQRVAQDWLVLTELTRDSGTAVGITTGLQFGPAVVLAPLAGVLADRYDRRRVLLATQASSGVFAAVLGALVLTGTARLWHVYVLAGLLGVSSAIDAPARQAFASELVPSDDLQNALALNSASFHIGRLLGPAVAGLMIHRIGTGLVFCVNAASFAAVLVALLRMRRGDLVTDAARSGRGGGMIEGLRYVRRRPELMVTMALVGVVGTFGLNFQLTTAMMARWVFAKGAGEYGLLGSVMAIGSLAGALTAARRGRPTLSFVIGAMAAFSVSCVVSGLMPTYATFAISLVPTGLAALVMMNSASAYVQLATDDELRGRVMALYMAIFLGGTPAGAPLVGWLGERFGARWAIVGGGAVCLAAAGVAAAGVAAASGGARALSDQGG